MNNVEQYPYPLTITKDRYNGVYSGTLFTAWNRNPDEVPWEVSSGDTECCCFWEEYYGELDEITDEFNIVGFGNTPEEALNDLIQKLKDKDLWY